MPQEYFIATTEKIKEGESFPFTYKGRKAILIIWNGEFKAFINMCTHDAGPICLKDGVILCKKHYAEFDPATGIATKLPAPPKSSLLEIKLHIRDNKIYHSNSIVLKKGDES